jgi:hypothetical protein
MTAQSAYKAREAKELNWVDIEDRLDGGRF